MRGLDKDTDKPSQFAFLLDNVYRFGQIRTHAGVFTPTTWRINTPPKKR